MGGGVYVIALVPLLPCYARAIWPQIDEWVCSATDDTGNWWSPANVLDGIERGNLVTWVIADEDRLYGVVACEIETAPNHTIGVISLCAGDEMQQWLHLLPEIENWASENGCSEVQVRGRPGWVRRLKSYGYGERYIAVGKALT